MPLFHHMIKGTSPGESWSFGLYTEGAGALVSAQAGWVASVSAFWAVLTDVVTTDIAVTELSTASITQATGGQISRVSDASVLVGTAEGEMLPFQCAVVVSFTTELATRAGRGRFYLPPLYATALDAGRISNGTRATVVSAVNAMWAGLGTAGLAINLYSRGAKTLTPVTGGSVGNVIDTQRRRRDKLIEVRAPLTPP